MLQDAQHALRADVDQATNTEGKDADNVSTTALHG